MKKTTFLPRVCCDSRGGIAEVPRSAPRSPRTSANLFRNGIAVLCILAATTSVRSNEDDGRWWWDSELRFSQQETSNVVNGVDAVGYDQQDLQVTLGLNGYIVHPMVASFRVDTSWLVNTIENGADTGHNRYGLGAELNLIPRGTNPLSVYYRKSIFDFSQPEGNTTTASRGIPDTTTRWGAHTRFRKGALRGTLLGVEHRDNDFLDPATRKGVYDRQVVGWARQGDDGRHHVRLERQVQEFGVGDLDTDDLTLVVDERWSLVPNWSWELSGDGLRRETSRASQPAREVRDYRLTNRIRGRVRQKDTVDFRLSLGTTEYDLDPSIDVQRASVFYRWRHRQAWVVAPFVQFDRQSRADRSLSSPSAGVFAHWNGTAGAFDTRTTARASFGTIREKMIGGTNEERREAYGLTASFAHGAYSSLRQSLELEWFTNEFRVQRERIVGLPDLGFAGSRLGAEDSYRARFNIGRAFDSRSISAWGEWSRRSGTSGAFGSGLESVSWRGGAQWAMHGISFQGDFGETTVEQTTASVEQRIEFVTFLATWKPLPYLSFRTAYRVDQRSLDLLPDIDSTNIEATMRLRLGLFSLDTSVYERTEDMPAGGRRQNRTIRWMLTSRFGGWLPIVTGTKRRGVIR